MIHPHHLSFYIDRWEYESCQSPTVPHILSCQDFRECGIFGSNSSIHICHFKDCWEYWSWYHQLLSCQVSTLRECGIWHRLVQHPMSVKDRFILVIITNYTWLTLLSTKGQKYRARGIHSALHLRRLLASFRNSQKVEPIDMTHCSTMHGSIWKFIEVTFDTECGVLPDFGHESVALRLGSQIAALGSLHLVMRTPH